MGAAPKTESLTLAAFGLTILFWASAFASIRVGLETFGPGHLALLRFLVASSVLVVYALLTRMKLPETRDLPSIAVAGFLGFTIHYLGISYGEVTVSAGAASLLTASATIFTALLAVAFLGEKLDVRGWVGTLVGFAGVAMISFGEEGGVRLDPGALAILVAAFSTSLYLVFQKPRLEKYGSLRFTAYAIWLGTVPMLLFLPGLAGAVRAAPPAATLNVVYLGTFPTVFAYVALAYAVSRTKVSSAASFLYLTSPLAILIAFLWLGEVPSALAIVGGAVVLLGVMAVTLRRRSGEEVT